MPRARPQGHGLGGRPRRPRDPDEIVTLTLRITAADRDAIQAAAQAAGLSASGWAAAIGVQDQRRPMTHIDVSDCRQCPFMQSDGNEYDGDAEFMAWCDHPPGSVGTLDAAAAWAGSPLPPPEWCPLRREDVIVRLRVTT